MHTHSLTNSFLFNLTKTQSQPDKHTKTARVPPEDPETLLGGLALARHRPLHMAEPSSPGPADVTTRLCYRADGTGDPIARTYDKDGYRRRAGCVCLSPDMSKVRFPPSPARVCPLALAAACVFVRVADVLVCMWV